MLIVKLLKKSPATADEVAARLNQNILYVRPRFSELSAFGLIEATGERRKNAVSLRNAIVWKLTETITHHYSV
jgi:predicted ArsR family transcriptional regulator